MKSTNLFLPVGDAVFFNISLEQEFNSNNKEHAFFCLRRMTENKNPIENLLLYNFFTYSPGVTYKVQSKCSVTQPKIKNLPL